MDGFLDAPFPAIRGQAPDLIPIVDISEEEIVVPQDGRLMHLQGLGAAELQVFEPVLQNPDEYLMARYAPFEELPDYWEEFSGNNYLGVQEHLQEEWDAPEQVEDMDDEGKHTKASSQPVDAMPSASQHVTKRDDSTTADCRLLKDIASSSSSIATIGLQDSAMPGASPAAFGPILDATTSEVQKLNI